MSEYIIKFEEMIIISGYINDIISNFVVGDVRNGEIAEMTRKISDIFEEITQREVAIAEHVATDNSATQNHPQPSSQISGDTD